MNEYIYWSACFSSSFTLCDSQFIIYSHELPFLSFDLSLILAIPMRSFCSLYKLLQVLCIFSAGFYWLFLNADSVKLRSFLLTTLYMLWSDILWGNLAALPPGSNRSLCCSSLSMDLMWWSRPFCCSCRTIAWHTLSLTFMWPQQCNAFYFCLS